MTLRNSLYSKPISTISRRQCSDTSPFKLDLQPAHLQRWQEVIQPSNSSRSNRHLVKLKPPCNFVPLVVRKYLAFTISLLRKTKSYGIVNYQSVKGRPNLSASMHKSLSGLSWPTMCQFSFRASSDRAN